MFIYPMRSIKYFSHTTAIFKHLFLTFRVDISPIFLLEKSPVGILSNRKKIRWDFLISLFSEKSISKRVVKFTTILVVQRFSGGCLL